MDYDFHWPVRRCRGESGSRTRFRHFVLPVRVNNENLDDSRKVFYEELKDPSEKLSLYMMPCWK